MKKRLKNLSGMMLAFCLIIGMSVPSMALGIPREDWIMDPSDPYVQCPSEIPDIGTEYHDPVPSVIKVYGAVETSTTSIYVNTRVMSLSDQAYRNSYVYVQSGKKVIGKAKYAGNTTVVKIPRQKRGTQLKIYFKNGKARTKTIYKVVVGDRDISTLKVTDTLIRPSAFYDFDTKSISITATPKAKVTVTAYKRTLATATIPASGHMNIKLTKAKLKLGETIWVYTSNKKGRSEFAKTSNSIAVVTPNSQSADGFAAAAIMV